MKDLFNKLYKETAIEFYEYIKSNLMNEKKMFIVTANPETFMKSESDAELNKLLNDKNITIVPDGIGIVKAAKMVKFPVKERIPGIDISIKLLEYGNELNKTIYFLGATQEVIDSLILVINDKYPNLKIVGAKNGFSKNKDKDFEDILKKTPDIILVALGIPSQEKLIYKHIEKFSKGIFVGVGGSLDVISGHKKRAPKIFIKLNLEWLYRIIKEPKRIKRFYESNIKFFFKLKKKVNIDSFFLMFFVLIIIAGLLNIIFNSSEINYYENRTNYQLPKSNLNKIIDKSFQNEMELAFSDQIICSTIMKKSYNFVNNLIPYINYKILSKKDCTNYIKINESINLFGCDDNLVYLPTNFKDGKIAFEHRVNNVNEILNKTSAEIFIYYIEKDTDINFKTNEKSDLFDYIKTNINTDNIYKFEINSFEQFKNYFYKIDHHWNYKGSYKAYTELVNILTNDEPLKYQGEMCVENQFNGSKTGTIGANYFYKEKFCAYTFDYPDYKITINGETKDYGNEQFLLSNPNEIITYGYFYGDDYAEIIIDNEQPTKKNILLIGESYDNAILKLLASHYNKTFSIDLRHYERTTGEKFNYEKYLKDNQIDQVILIGNRDYFGQEIFDVEV